MDVVTTNGLTVVKLFKMLCELKILCCFTKES